MSRRSRTGTRARGISLFFVDEFQAFDMATTKSDQCRLCGSCTFGLKRQTRTISSIPFVCERDFPSRLCFSPVDRKYFGREEFTRGDRRTSTSLFRKQVRHLIAEDSNMVGNPLNANSAFL
ncbi:hypothetical protein AVEN_160982-1 [Araneus ventricosus]|uniref:Uncharacterized protein n=1 Tax=Araneus ventricosus TaxID=182803 RepID=A0A4Y2XDH1_ARAVE|nr:hypothetical protein AVEN_241144-1 [Araneus ventricosus]GBO46122.1 hypothetical protein AVEN_16397-1 [Araneus ventricosus]GBO46123.1 hypothetical protein AVEN_27688-1 [Araneus ventricosus]GBO46125.1 hypothetical protein AVEN_160982-1 [Araneus ventricosus]